MPTKQCADAVNVRKIVADYLKAHGFDGLANTDNACLCGCGLNYLVHCESACDLCEPAYRWECDKCRKWGCDNRTPGFGCWQITKPRKAVKHE